MADLEILKERTEQASLRLKTAHAARERESAALIDMWNQIRERFSNQNAELAALRGRIAALEDTRDELLAMVRTLLAAIEGGIERMADETVPRITAMAGELLAAEPAAADPAPAAEAPDPAEGGDAGEDFEAALAAVLDAPPPAPDPEPAPEAADRHAEAPMRDEPVGATLSPGIRTLIARVERAFHGEAAAAAAPAAPAAEDEDGDELDRDLREIEELRAELEGLRRRLSVEGA